MDDDQRGTSEGIRIIGASEPGPTSAAPAGHGVPSARPVPAATWDDADDEAWDDAWLAGDGDLEDVHSHAADHSADDQTSLWPSPVEANSTTPTGRAPAAVVASVEAPSDDSQNPRSEPAPDAEYRPGVADTEDGLVSIDDDESPQDGRSSWATYAASAASAGTGHELHVDDEDDEDDEDDNAIDDDFGPDDNDFDDEFGNKGDNTGSNDGGQDDESADDESTVLVSKPAGKPRASRPTAADRAVPLVSGSKSGSGGSSTRPTTGSGGSRSSRSRAPRVENEGPDRGAASGRAGARRPVGSGSGSGSTSAGTPVATSQGSRVLTGVGLALAAIVILKFGHRPGAVLLVTVVGLIAVQELFTGLRQRGFLPAILPILATVLVLPVTAYKRGSDGVMVVLVLAVLVSLLWYLIGPVRDRPVVNIAVSILGLIYVGLFVGVAGLILRGPHGLGILVAVIVGAAVHDIAGLFVGKNIGRVAVAPEVSPNKTVEGLAGGVIAAMFVMVVYGHFVAPFKGDLSAAIVLAIAVGVLAPLGDLVESMLKRDLGIKDMGNVLPGHGGVLDRIDAMLFVLPAVYLIAVYKRWV